jgi:hypothetical protein
VFSGAFFSERKEGGFNRMKIPLLFLGLSLTLSGIAQAGPARGGYGGGGSHGGFVGRGPVVFRGGGGFRGRSFARRNRPVYFQQYGWPAYWYPYGYSYPDPLSYSYLDPDSSSDYQYWDNSAAYAQPAPANVRPENNRGVPQTPVIIVVNNGNPHPTDSGVTDDPKALVDPHGNGGYVNNNGYVSASVVGQPRTVMQDPNQHAVPDGITPGAPVIPQASPQPKTQSLVQKGVFGKLVVVGWLRDGDKDVISVKNIETNDVQRITSQPNIDHLRLVEVHPNPDPRQFEAIISNGSDQGAVRFQF